MYDLINFCLDIRDLITASCSDIKFTSSSAVFGKEPKFINISFLSSPKKFVRKYHLFLKMVSCLKSSQASVFVGRSLDDQEMKYSFKYLFDLFNISKISITTFGTLGRISCLLLLTISFNSLISHRIFFRHNLTLC